MLYPFQNEFRNTPDLSGIWDLKPIRMRLAKRTAEPMGWAVSRACRPKLAAQGLREFWKQAMEFRKGKLQIQ